MQCQATACQKVKIVLTFLKFVFQEVKMKKYFFLVLMSILFLGACGGPVPDEVDPKKQDPPRRPSDEVADPNESRLKNVDTELRTPLPISLQACRANLISATWNCQKGEEIYNYFLNHRPTVIGEPNTPVIDEPNTPRARRRICELHAKKAEQESSQITLAYAHYERYHCVNTLNIEITAKQGEGFQCSGQEVLDEKRAGNPC